MQTTQIWILSSVASLLLVVCGFGLRTAGSLILQRLDKIAELLQDLQLSRATHSQDIRQLQETADDHEQRIRKVEYKNITEKL